MIGIESYAYSNRWRVIHPRDKMWFALATLLLCILPDHVVPSLVVLVVMTWLITVQAGVPGKYYAQLLAVPAGFILIGALTIAVSISSNPSGLLWHFSLGSYYAGLTEAGISQGILLLARCGGAVSCLLFLALTTPLDDITCQLERWKIPYAMIEMMTLLYRFIFVFWQLAVTIHTAQAARLGHVDFKTSLRSLGYLISSLFIHTLDRTHALYNALVARGYTDSLRVLEADHESTPALIKVGFMVFDLLLLGLIVFEEVGL